MRYHYKYHYTPPKIVTKQCPKCNEHQPITNYSLHKNTRDKRDSYCKKCNKEEYQRKREERIAHMIIENHKKRGYNVTLTKTEIIQLRQQHNNKKCPVCNKTMQITPYQEKGKITKTTGKNAPSIDIKNPKNKTMDKHNTWVICKECNLLKSNLTPQECYKAAKKLIKIALLLQNKT